MHNLAWPRRQPLGRPMFTESGLGTRGSGLAIVVLGESRAPRPEPRLHEQARPPPYHPRDRRRDPRRLAGGAPTAPGRAWVGRHAVDTVARPARAAAGAGPHRRRHALPRVER